MPCWSYCNPYRPCGASGCRNWRSPPPNFGQYYQGSSPWGDGRQEDGYWTSNNVRMGVGYSSARDLDMAIHTGGVIRGPESVHLASGNRAGRDLRAQVYGNVVDPTRDLSIGVGNASGHGNDLIVCDNEFRGRKESVNIGVGNRSGGPIKIVVAGNRWMGNSQP